MAYASFVLGIFVRYKIPHWYHVWGEDIRARGWLDKVFRRGFMNPPIDHDHAELVVILQYSNVFQRIAIDQNAVSVEAWLYLAKLILLQKKLRYSGCGRNDRFHGGVIK